MEPQRLSLVIVCFSSSFWSLYSCCYEDDGVDLGTDHLRQGIEEATNLKF